MQNFSFRQFRDDIAGAIDDLEDDGFARLLCLFRGPGGRFAWLGPRRTFDVYGMDVAELALGHAWPLLEALDCSQLPARRRVRKEVRDDIDAVVWAHCAGLGPRLLDHKGLPRGISIDLRRARHDRHKYLRERIAERRRHYRGRRELNVAPETLARWEANRACILDGLDASPRVYL